MQPHMVLHDEPFFDMLFYIYYFETGISSLDLVDRIVVIRISILRCEASNRKRILEHKSTLSHPLVTVQQWTLVSSGHLWDQGCMKMVKVAYPVLRKCPSICLVPSQVYINFKAMQNLVDVDHDCGRWSTSVMIYINEILPKIPVCALTRDGFCLS